MIVPGLSNKILFPRNVSNTTFPVDEVNGPPWRDLGGYRDTTKGHLVVWPCCHGSPPSLEDMSGIV